MRRIEGTLYRIRTTTNTFFVETEPHLLVQEDEDELCVFCADFVSRGNVITSVAEIKPDGRTPKVLVLSSKIYKAAMKRIGTK